MRYFPKGTAPMDEPVLEQAKPSRDCSFWRTHAGEEKKSEKEGAADRNLYLLTITHLVLPFASLRRLSVTCGNNKGNVEVFGVKLNLEKGEKRRFSQVCKCLFLIFCFCSLLHELLIKHLF